MKKSQKNATSKKKQPVLRLEPVEAKLVLEADACTRFLKSVVRAGAVKPDIKSMSCPKRDEQIN